MSLGEYIYECPLNIYHYECMQYPNQDFQISWESVKCSENMTTVSEHSM